MEEEYEEVYDRTKVFALIIGLVSAGVLVYFFTMVVDFDELKIPEIEIEIPETEPIQPAPVELEPGKGVVKDEYFKYIDFGISIDDIIDIQSMPCEVFGGNETLSTDSKYENIFNQRRTECGL